MYTINDGEYNQRYRSLSGNNNNVGSRLSELKRLLASRSSVDIRKATGFIAELIERCPAHSVERERVVQHLIGGDICVFLCDAMACMDRDVVCGVAHCLQLMSPCRLFVGEAHAAYAVSCAVRTSSSALAGGAAGKERTLLACLQLIGDILLSVRHHEQQSALDCKSLYNTEQLLRLLAALAEGVTGALPTALVLHLLLSHRPPGLRLSLQSAEDVACVLEAWLPLLGVAMADSPPGSANADLFYEILCHLAIDTQGLCKSIQSSKSQTTFVDKIITSDEDILHLKQQAKRMAKSVYLTSIELITYTKNNWENIGTSEYSLFLTFLKQFLVDPVNAAILPSFSEMLANTGYLALLPKNKIARSTAEVDALSTCTLGALLSQLCRQFLGADSVPCQPGQYSLHLTNMQKELSFLTPDSAQWVHSLSSRLRTEKPYSLLIYLYFHCLTTDSPQDVSGPLLPPLVEHINRLPPVFQPPDHIIKALWLVFSMSLVSYSEPLSLHERVCTERAARRLAHLLEPRSAAHYTHHPCLLLAAFVSSAFTDHFKRDILQFWLQREDFIPEELVSHVPVLNLLLELVRCSDGGESSARAVAILKQSVLERDKDAIEDFGITVWTSLPDALVGILQNYESNQAGSNLQYLVELATDIVPRQLDSGLQQKLTLLISMVFNKMNSVSGAVDLAYNCLKLAFFLLQISKEQADQKVLTILVNATGFLPSALRATCSPHMSLACMALQLLSAVVFNFARSDCHCDKELSINPTVIATILRKEMNTPKGPAFLQLFYAIMSNADCERTVPITLGTGPSEEEAGVAMRTLLVTVQMICCKESRDKSVIGWKTLTMMMKYIIDYTRDCDMITAFTTQPWMFILVRFQLSQRIMPELLVFIKSWLCCLKIIFSDRERYYKTDSSYSLFGKTLIIIRNALKNISVDDRLPIVNDIEETVEYFLVDDIETEDEILK